MVPLVGKGTADDPRRPAFVPAPAPKGTPPPTNGIIGFTMVLSDDGKSALVEFVARDRAALAAILADTRPGVKVFEKGKAKRDEILLEFRKHKKDFDFERLGVSLP